MRGGFMSLATSFAESVASAAAILTIILARFSSAVKSALADNLAAPSPVASGVTPLWKRFSAAVISVKSTANRRA